MSVGTNIGKSVDRIPSILYNRIEEFRRKEDFNQMAKKIIAVVLCLVFVLAILASCGANKPEAVIKSLEKAINKKDGKAMMKLFDPDTQKLLEGYGITGDTIVSMMFSEMEGKKVSLTCGDIKYNDDKTEAVVEVTAKMDGETSTDEITCKKVGGKWYISGGF